MPVITGVHTIAIPVADQDRALAFYRALGFETRRDVPMGERARWIEVAPPGVATGVRLTTADVGAAHEALAASGVDVDDVLRWPGVPPMCAFRDQDGNGLVVVEA